MVRITPDNPAGFLSQLYLEDLVAVNVDDEFGLITALVFEVQQTEEQRKYYDSFGFYVYASLSPAPDPAVWGYSGSNAVFRILPSLSKVLYQIPFTQEFRSLGTPPSVNTEKPLRKDQLPLLASVLPLMKGVPSKAASETIAVRIFPIVADLGVIDLTLEYEGEQQAQGLTLNGKEMALNGDSIVVPTGIHVLTIKMTEDYKKEVSLIVEKGKRSAVRVYIEKPDAKIFFNIPESGSLFVDGEKVTVFPTKPVSLSPGVHTATVRVAGYSLSKTFTVSSGKTYTISIIMDMEIKEKSDTK